ncbi:hypothetical protein COLO4_03980 [Corchorus olitorius]|uniref:RNase H type-1 domain-containing protein n=1 Tax=Corchorus olitorius TaxID=93759 RepID=A0A1R3KVV7_9ROSI|nr:hypothetical protein COLO4_03980 [Corchorus olitorius]
MKDFLSSPGAELLFPESFVSLSHVHTKKLNRMVTRFIPTVITWFGTEGKVGEEAVHGELLSEQSDDRFQSPSDQIFTRSHLTFFTTQRSRMLTKWNSQERMLSSIAVERALVRYERPHPREDVFNISAERGIPRLLGALRGTIGSLKRQRKMRQPRLLKGEVLDEASHIQLRLEKRLNYLIFLCQAVVRFYPFESRSTGGSSSESLSRAERRNSSQQMTEVGNEKGKEKRPESGVWLPGCTSVTTSPGLNSSREEGEDILRRQGRKRGSFSLAPKDRLWTKFLRAKYNVPEDLLLYINSVESPSPSWSHSCKGLVALEDMVDDNVMINYDYKVADFILHGSWNTDLLFAQLPMELALQVIGYLQPQYRRMGNKLVWSYTSNGVFSTKSDYDAMQDQIEDGSLNLGWLYPPLCSRCSTHVEDTLHVLRDCVEARKVWRCYFLTIIWRLWTSRCKFIFRTDDDVVWDNEHAMVRDIDMSALEVCKAYSRGAKKKTDNRLISWQLPSQGFVKVNTDGASMGNPGISGAGGVIRDAAGQWIIGFKAHLGTWTNMVAEPQAIPWGLSLAWKHGFRQVIGDVGEILEADVRGLAEPLIRKK